MRVSRRGANAMIGGSIVGLLILVAAIGPQIAPHNPLGLDLPSRMSPTSTVAP